MKGLPIVAADVVEVAPAYDHAGVVSQILNSCRTQFALVTPPCTLVALVTLLSSGITSMAAANIMLEQIALISSCMDLDGFDT